MPREIVFLSEELQPLRFKARARRCRVVRPLKGRGVRRGSAPELVRRFNQAMSQRRFRVGNA